MQESRKVDEILSGSMPAPDLVNRFNLIVHNMNKNINQGRNLKNPHKSLINALKHMEYLEGEYFFSNGYGLIFRVKDNVIDDILVLPKLSDHAKQRLAERFNVLTPKERLLRLALDFKEGKILSPKDLKKINIRATDATALRCRDRIYIISTTERTVITIIQVN